MDTKIKKTLQWLEAYSFIKTVDEIGMATQNCPLYYKQVKGNDFLIITHYNSKKNISNQGFDVFYFYNLNPLRIGKEHGKPDDFAILSFDIDRDLEKLRVFLADKTDQKII